MSAYIILRLLILLFVSDVLKANKTFTATDDWQTLEEGEKIPPGLHVRINLETGKKEARLLKVEEKMEESKSALINVGEEDKNVKLDHEELKQILKNIKNDGDSSKSTSTEKFRSYDEIKKEFKNAQMDVKTDAEVLSERFAKFRQLKNLSSEDDISLLVSLLTDFEFLVHQYDNALEFARLDGFALIIIPSLNVTEHSQVRSEALRVLGGATQSNPRVQKAALDSGCIAALLKILALETDQSVRSKGLFALSCLLRSFPAAQFKFIQDGGVSALSKVFDGSQDENSRIKIMRLLTDLLLELQESSDIPNRKEKYDSIHLDLNLREQGWCKRSSDWLCRQMRWQDISELHEDEVDHQSVEVAIDLLQSISTTCLDDFVMNIQLLNVINHAKQFYGDLALREMDEGMGESVFSDIHTKLRNFATTLARTAWFKDEL